MLRYILFFTVTVLFTAPLFGQTLSVKALDGNFRALTESGSRILGLDYANGIFASEDGGTSFGSLSTLTTDPLDIYYTLSSIGSTVIAVGADGLIARSTSQGSTWSSSVNTDFISGDLVSVAGRSGASPASNSWISVGTDGLAGVILSSSDDGASWAEADRFNDVELFGATWTGSAWLACGGNAYTYEGLIYRSTDGTTWNQVTLPVGAESLLSLAADGAGNVVAVGDAGAILYSSDHGQTFQEAGVGLLSESLFTVIATGTNSFAIGGAGKSILTMQGSTVTILHQVVSGAPDVKALLYSGGSVLAAGAFVLNLERTIPLALKIAKDGNTFTLTIEQSLAGKVYTLQSSIDLENWTMSGSAVNGTDGAYEWLRPVEGPRLFWRVEEF